MVLSRPPPAIVFVTFSVARSRARIAQSSTVQIIIMMTPISPIVNFFPEKSLN